jgi:hypothetical protein
MRLPCFIPDKPEPGILYISREYNTATHICCCGCGLEVVTPLNAAKWSIKDHGDSVSLFPSIGNWSFPCKSHYWIDHGSVVWAGTMTNRQITSVRKRDQLAVQQMIKGDKEKTSWIDKFIRWIKGR